MKNRAWIFLIPTMVFVSLNAFIPLITVVNYSVHYIFSGSLPQFVGLKNYLDVLKDPMFQGALFRQVILSVVILLVEIPVGIIIALSIPKKGVGVAISLVMLGIPLLIPYNVVGIIWRLFTQESIGVIPRFMALFGYTYNVALDSFDAPVTIFIIDIWHWTPLVALLVYAGLQTIPDAFYHAAEIDGATPWKTFRFVTLPKLRNVLLIGILLRFMDSFKIYSEPLTLTGGGPGTVTTYLNLFVARRAEAYELGYAGAASIVYLLIVITLSYVFFQVLTHVGTGGVKK